MIRSALLVLLCWGYSGESDVIGRGTATRRTVGYARQDALIDAKDDGYRQCDKIHKVWYFDQEISNDCFVTGQREVECTAKVCGHCLERQP